MWKKLGFLVLKHRVALLLLLLATTGLMGYFASKVKLSYEFSKAIPVDNPKYQDYLRFRKTFGDDGNILVLGIKTNKLFESKTFTRYRKLQNDIRNQKFVEDVLGVPGAVVLMKDSLAEKLVAKKIFDSTRTGQQALDSAKAVFENLPFYKSLLYNPNSKAYLMAVRINKDVLNSPGRSGVVQGINKAAEDFQKSTGIEVHLSGLPLIRTMIADRIQKEMKVFLFGSLALSVLILMMFFRSVSTTILSMLVVIIGVVWTLALIYLFGYKITLLTALIPSLVVVIGIPNCIYFINKYHTAYIAGSQTNEKERKQEALVAMVSKMGVVTLFCNLTAAIGFAVFALTKSAILNEFGAVAGISIMLIFVISFILLPAALSFLPAPKPRELKYLTNRFITHLLDKIENWTVHHKGWIIGTTAVVLVFAVLGLMKLKSVGYIVDDLPKKDKIYTDLKFFEQNFKGVMPLEIVVDTKRKNGLTGMRALKVYEKVDSLDAFIARLPETNRPLSVAEGLKFAKQAFYENDSTQYLMPNAFDGAFVADYLRPSSGGKTNNLSKMMTSFIDSSRQRTRLSVNMADVGTIELPEVIDTIKKECNRIFDSSQYRITYTGASITFLEGSKFIINGLKESILWAFGLIALCMLYLFKSARIVACSLIPNIIPLVITAGIMGWAGVPLKPSTVLVFSVALGIAIDITIRFLVNYRQDLSHFNGDIEKTVRSTVHQTGISIIYTALVLTAGFVIFCASSFGGTFALGWLTSVTLVTATLTNLTLLPVLLLITTHKKNQR